MVSSTYFNEQRIAPFEYRVGGTRSTDRPHIETEIEILVEREIEIEITIEIEIELEIAIEMKIEIEI